MDKNKQIAKSMSETRSKRKTQECKVFELKIDYSSCNLKTKEALKMSFVEAKWLYNYYLSQNDIFNQDTKISKVTTLNKDKQPIEKELKYITSKHKQQILKDIQTSIRSLAKKKSYFYKVGRLKYKSDYSSLDYNQFNNTHSIKNNRIKLLGIKQHLRVHGLQQITDEYEIANLKLIKKASGYYIKITCFRNQQNNRQTTNQVVGLDFGIKNNITTSDGEVFNCSIGETKRLKRLQRKIAKSTKGSNNRNKLRLKLQKEYEYMFNKKKDSSNKVVFHLIKNYDTIYMQDELISLWHKGLFGKQVQHSYLGLIKAKLKKQDRVVVIESKYPTTKMCYECGALNTITLKDRQYICDCGLNEDRDIKAAKTVMLMAQNKVPTEHRNFKPVELSKNKDDYETGRYTSKEVY